MRSSLVAYGDIVESSALPAWKRAIDIAFCILTLPFTLPIFAGIATVIKCFSKGPILFRQERVGYQGEIFTCYKFRTMRADARPTVHQTYASSLADADVPMTKMDIKGDQRLLPMAWIIRAIGLDELPQLINVARGEMSVVGPRPCVLAEFEAHPEAYRRRCNAYPGITGLWQVNGKNRTTFREMIELDERYAHERSFWLDLAIIARTPYAVLIQFLDSRRGRVDVNTRQARRSRS